MATREEILTAVNLINKNVKYIDNIFGYLKEEQIPEFFDHDIRDALWSANLDMIKILDLLESKK